MNEANGPEAETDTAVETDDSKDDLTSAQIIMLEELADALGQDKRAVRIAYKQRAGIKLNQDDLSDFANVALQVSDAKNTTPVLSDHSGRFDIGIDQMAYGQQRIHIVRHHENAKHTDILVGL